MTIGICKSCNVKAAMFKCEKCKIIYCSRCIREKEWVEYNLKEYKQLGMIKSKDGLLCEECKRVIGDLM